HQSEQRALLTQHAALDTPYLHRAYTQMKVTLVDGSTRIPCDEPGPVDGWRSCPDQPEFMELRVATRRLRGINRECIQLHPPERGHLELEFPELSPPPRVIGGGLEDWSRRTGGTPVEMTWKVGDAEPVTLTVDDEDETSYAVK